MIRADESNLVKQMASINDYIENFTLERTTGTKALRKKFHNEAIDERNKYVNEQLILMNQYKQTVMEQIRIRVKTLIPVDNTELFENKQDNLERIKDLVIYNNAQMSNSFKVGFYDLVSQLKEDMSFERLNRLLEQFIFGFEKMGVKLHIDDFSYTMFTEEYFNTFLKTNDEVERKNSFERIYWECPSLVLEIKQMLKELLRKYEKELNNYREIKTVDLEKEINIPRGRAEEVYQATRSQLDVEYESDEFNILKTFVAGKKTINDYLRLSSTRAKKYDTFLVNKTYAELPSKDKAKYLEAVKDLYKTLKFLKLYYKYEPIVEDIIKKYNEKDGVKANFASIKKEMDENNKNRVKLNKEYLKSKGIGFMAKADPNKQTLLKVKTNELFNKIQTDIDSYDNLKISLNIDESINNGSNLSDVFKIALSSYSYLTKILTEINAEEESVDIYKEIDDYINFVFDPNGKFIEGIFVFNNVDIAETICNKYRLLGLNINTDKISKDSIDTILNDVAFVILVEYIDSNKLTMENIKFVVDYNRLERIELDQNLI